MAKMLVNGIWLSIYLLVPCCVIKCEVETQTQDLSPELPYVDSNATNNYWNTTPTEIDQCDLNQQKSKCNAQFTISKEQCDGKLSFRSLINHYYPDDIFSSVMNYFIIPEKFDVTKFYINTCKEQMEFFAEAREDIDLIPNRLRVSDATLSLNVMFRVESLYYAIISFELNGFVHVENRKLEVTAIKQFGNDPLNIRIKVNQISPKDFCKLFSVLEFTSFDLPTAVEELKSVSLSDAVIVGTYKIEGCFEFILKGKPDTSDVFQQSEVYVVIQKPCNERVSAGLLAHFPCASFHHILSGVLGKEVSLRVPILWYSKHSIALHSSPSGILKVKNDDFNRVFRFFTSRSMAINMGLTLSVEFPMQDYTKQVAPVIPDTSVPIKLLFVAKMNSKKVHITFETDLELSLDNSLLLFMSKAKAASISATLKRIDTPVKVNKMELLLATRLIVVYITVKGTFTMTHSLVPIKDFELRLQKSVANGWQIIGQGTGDISGVLFKTKIKKEDKSDAYKFLGKTELISSSALVESFAKDSGALEILNSFPFLKFKLRDVLIGSQVGSSLGFRITGKSQIFEYEVTQYCEAVIYNNTRLMPGFALGIIFKRIKFDELLVKMYGERDQRSSWLQNVDCGILISNDNENENSKTISFQFIELNEFTLKRGISMMLRVYLPKSCAGDGLCELIKSSQEVKESTGMLFKGDVTPSELTLEWTTSTFRISQNIQLTDVVCRIIGGQNINVYLLARLETQGVSMQGSIISDVSGGVLIQMSMDANLESLFGVNGLAAGELSYKGTIYSDTTTAILELHGKMFLGTVHLDKRIIGEAVVYINIADPQQSFFYSKISSFDFATLLEAFGFNSKIPIALQQVQFTEPTIASFTNNLYGMELQALNLHIQNEFTIQGILSILGIYGQYTIFTSSEMISIVVELPKCEFAKGLVKMYSSPEMQSSIKYDGPRFIARITKETSTMRLEGMVKVLGVSSNVNMSVSDAGYIFYFSGSILGTFDADVNASAVFANPKDANFQITSCIPTALPNVTYEIVKLLKSINQSTDGMLHSTKSRIRQMEAIFSRSHKRLAIHSKTTESFRKSMRSDIRSLEKFQEGRSGSCPKDCKNVCMSAPGWVTDALEFGHYYVGSPKWLRCTSTTPDMVCVVRCLGRSVIRNVKAFNKQKHLQKTVQQFEESKKKEKRSKEFLQRAIYSVGDVINKLGNVNSELGVGISVAKSFVGRSSIEDAVRIDKVCMEGNIESAVNSKIGFSITGEIGKERINMKVYESIDSDLWKNLASAVCNQVYTNASSFKQKLNHARWLMRDIDAGKMTLLQDLKQDIIKNDIGEATKKDAVSDSEESEFKKYAYMELQRYTLGNDGVVKFFSKLSPWKLIVNNDPLENAFLSNSTRRMVDREKEETFDEVEEEASKKSGCPRVYEAMKGYRDILQVASGVAENFFEEKISFLKTKNRQLASLRDIEDQIKSDCYLENCTTGELNDALKYSEKAKAGVVDWVKEVRHQIGKHDRASLQILSENIGSIIEKVKKSDLKTYLQSLNDKLLKVYKRSSIENARQSKMVTFLEQIDLDVRDLLLNGREKRISEAAPMIFTMKDRVKKLSRSIIRDCESKHEDDLIRQVLDKV